MSHFDGLSAIAGFSADLEIIPMSYDGLHAFAKKNVIVCNED